MGFNLVGVAGAWAQMEQEWANTLNSNDAITNVKINIVYGTNGRPVGFEVEAFIHGVKKNIHILIKKKTRIMELENIKQQFLRLLKNVDKENWVTYEAILEFPPLLIKDIMRYLYLKIKKDYLLM
jgi:hypothetical protein